MKKIPLDVQDIKNENEAFIEEVSARLSNLQKKVSISEVLFTYNEGDKKKILELLRTIEKFFT